MKARRKWFKKTKTKQNKTKQKNPTLNSRDNYYHSQPKTGKKKKNLMGKLNEKKKIHKRWRSKNVHDKEAHRLLLLTEVKTKEYRHSECMEKYQLH